MTVWYKGTVVLEREKDVEVEEEKEEDTDCVSFESYSRLKATAIPSFSSYRASPYVTLSPSLISPTLPISRRLSVLLV